MPRDTRLEPGETPQVALLIETSRGYGRDISLGIARYARLHGPWSFHLTPGDFEQKMPDRNLWHGHGAFARLTGSEFCDQLLQAGIPTVALDMSEEQLVARNPLHVITDLRVDSVEAARLAAEHLFGLKLGGYAFVGTPGKVWSDRREASFCELVASEGLNPQVYRTKPVGGRVSWDFELPRLTQWVTELPKPVGIMCCNDEHGLHVLDACRRADAKVPEEIAVVGVDNDTLLCELCNPTLSSVVLNGVEAGYQAAAHLAELMRDGRNRPTRIVVDALRVEPRESTDRLAMGSEPVTRALAFMRQSMGQALNADAVAEHVKVSRRELDSLFRDTIGRSISVEIQRRRLEHAKRLLDETDHSIPTVAKESGYSSASYMIQVFQRELETTPAKYRSEIRTLSAHVRQNDASV